MEKKRGGWGNGQKSFPAVTYKKKEATAPPLKPEEQKTVKLPLNCEGYYVQNFIPEEDRKQLYETLFQEIPWENHGMKRDTCLYGDEGILYPYGLGYGEEKAPSPWIESLKKVKLLVEEYTHAQFDICLCGYYKDGKKSIGFHSDREELGKTTEIASISLGAERWFAFRSKNVSEPEHKMMLHDGSLLVMGLYCQERYTHSLIQDNAVKSGRINLTFRNSGSIPQTKAELLAEGIEKLTIKKE